MICGAWLVRVLAKRVQEPFFRQRWSKQRPSAKIAPHHDQGLKIRNRIDTFGNHDTAETVGKINRRLAYRGIGDVFLTNKACSLSSVNGRSRRLENDE